MIEEQYYENDELWSSERFLMNDSELKRYSSAASLISLDANSLLDVGTGNGAFLRFLENAETKLSLTGLERSQSAIANKLCNAVIQAGKCDELPFDSKSFDVVTALEVLEHLPHRVYEETLEELERVTRSQIIITIPYKERRALVECPYCECRFDRNYHMRKFTITELQQLFKGLYLEKWEIVTQEEYAVMPIVRIFRSLMKRNSVSSTSICPQCGYSQVSEHQSIKTHEINTQKRSLKWIPKRQRPVWFAAVYRRNQ